MATSQAREPAVVVKDPEDSASGLLELHLYLGEERVGHAFAEPREDRVMLLRELELEPGLRGQGLGTFLLRRLEEVTVELWFKAVRVEVSWLDDATPSDQAADLRAAWLTRRGYVATPRGDHEYTLLKRLE